MKKAIIGVIILVAIVAAAAGFIVCENPFECSKNVTISVNDGGASGISVINGTVEVPNNVNFEQVTEVDGSVWNKNTGDEYLEIGVFHVDNKLVVDEAYKQAINSNSRDSDLLEIDNDGFNNAHVYETRNAEWKYVVLFESGNSIIKIRCDNLDTAKMIFNSIKVDVPTEQTTTTTTEQTTTTTTASTTTKDNGYSLQVNGNTYQGSNQMDAESKAYRAENKLD